MTNVLVKMPPVEMKQIYRAIGEVWDRLVERRSNEPGERCIPLIVIPLQLREYLFAIQPGVNVSFPRIHRETTGIQTQAFDGLAKRQQRKTAVCSKFHDERGSQRLDEPKG